MLLRRGSPSRFAAYLRCLVTTSLRAEKSTKKASKLRGFFEKLFSASRSSDGGPRVPRRGPQARLPAFLQGEIRRPESLHIHSPRRHFCPESLVNMQTICLADGEAVTQGSSGQFSFPEGSLGARKGPWKMFCKSEVATKMASSSNPCISTVSRGLIEEG